MPVSALNLLLTVLTALTTVVAMRMVGVLLVCAMIVIPDAHRLRARAGASTPRPRSPSAWRCSRSTSGLIAAYYLRLAAGGAVVLAALLIFAAASLARRRWPATARGAQP